MYRNVKYSPAYTLVPTYECFNRCEYCNFRVDPSQDAWLTLEQAEARLQALQGQGICEILILSGEVHPESKRRDAWLERIEGLCELAIALGFLPHTNVGPLKYEEMLRLKAVNVSMGLMVEQVSPELMQTVHRHAPSKRPELRLQQLEWAGELQIPFTTGLLLGIGETEGDRRDTLEAIAQIHQRWGHIQEVIIQPYSLGNSQILNAPGFPLEQLPSAIAIARRALPDDITLQIPPNLVRYPDLLVACLEAGARDLGGICPRDEVNPDYPHPHLQALQEVLSTCGWYLYPRLPVYPQYEGWLNPALQSRVQQWRNAFTLLSPVQPNL
ncbi:MAG: 7,8-didemethyl-8-hydroxy-5-deazariboflavin synthase subunit CofG [Desertifilum sp.]|nr:7,8-didemethyl-8-hydroxy-5-deazariboflavin synthase subunit CofG [Desertifilum sp.]